MTLLTLVPTAASASGVIRVAVAESVRVAELRGADIETAELAPCEGCTANPSRSDTVHAVAVARAIDVGGRRAAGFRLRSDRPIRVNGREYGGILDLVANGDGFAIVNELPLDEYVAGVLRGEIGERWPVEALRAQAIVARTYAAYYRGLNAGRAYHIVASTANQQYAGRVAVNTPLWSAAQDTTGQVLFWEGEVFPAFYHADSGGSTEDPRTVFAARNMPALKPVVCRFSLGSPHYYWNADLRLADLAEALRRNGTDVGAVKAIDVSERTESLRASSIRVRGTRGIVGLRGNDLRRIVGYDTLKSTLFAVAVDGGVAHFSGRGYGHGVGMCQWGARAMAEQGHPAHAILAFYYPGTTLGLLNPR